MIQHQQALFAYVHAFITELAATGVRHVCISPGSRSTPLAMVCAQQPNMKMWLHIDERSAGFFALGLAKATNTPVALVCTSGTAAANYLPAVVEARYSRVPLLLLTADRPHELRECGAPQAIDQINLYGRHAKWFNDMPIPEQTPELLRYAHMVACRAVGTAQAEPAGPVHINFPFREPLVPIPAAPSAAPVSSSTAPEPPASGDTKDAYKPLPSSLPYVSLSHPGRRLDRKSAVQLAEELQAIPEGLIICGPHHSSHLREAVLQLASVLGYPVLADPLSQVRCGPDMQDICIDAYDAFLRDETFAKRKPGVVLRFGAMPTSKAVLLYLQRHGGCRHIVVDQGDGWNEPTGLATSVIHADAETLCYDLLDYLHTKQAGSPAVLQPGTVQSATLLADGQQLNSSITLPPWLNVWQTANQVTQKSIADLLAQFSSPFEGSIFPELRRLLPENAIVYVGNSMPVRDLDTFFPASPKSLSFYANRGANGIDGVVSSALGAAAGTSQPTVLVIGDLSFYYDLGGLLAAKMHGLHLVIVLVNNNGGGIFSFLPQAEHKEHFEELFGTPLNLDFRPAVEMYGGRHILVSDWQTFHQAVSTGLCTPGLWVVEVRTQRTENVTQHRAVWQAVSAALRAAGL